MRPTPNYDFMDQGQRQIEGCEQTIAQFTEILPHATDEQRWHAEQSISDLRKLQRDMRLMMERILPHLPHG